MILKLCKRNDGLLEPLDNESMDYLGKLKPVETVFAEVVKEKSTGSTSMLRTWRMWMAETASFMASRGVTIDVRNTLGEIISSREFNGDDAHELFTMRWLGSDEEGVRYSWATGKGKRKAPKDKRLYAMDKHLSWATDKGLKLTIPQDSEILTAEREGEL